MRSSGLLIAATVSILPFPAGAQADAAPSGRELFQGFRAFAAGQQVTDRNLPAGFAACANCHGADGAGKQEGGVRIPPIDMGSLTSARGAMPGFATNSAILAAIEQGIGRDGRALRPLMPRYRLAEDEAHALLLYLPLVGTREDRPHGVSVDEVRLGALLPVTGPLADEGKAVLAGMQETVDAANGNGGIYGRRLVLVAEGIAPDPLSAVDRLLRRDVFAVVGGLWSANEAELERRLAAARVPVIASLVVRESPPANTSWVTDLMASRSEQRKRLMPALATCRTNGPRWLFWGEGEGETADGIDAVDGAAVRNARGTEGGCIGYDLGHLKAVEQASLEGWRREIVLPFPNAVLRRDGGDMWRGLGRAALKIAVEALSASGAALHEASLLEALPKLKGFEPIAGAPIHFARTRTNAWEPDVLSLEPAVSENDERGR